MKTARGAGACVVAILLVAAAAAIAAPPPQHASSLVVRFHLRTARCDVAGTSRPLAMKLVCS